MSSSWRLEPGARPAGRHQSPATVAAAEWGRGGDAHETEREIHRLHPNQFNRSSTYPANSPHGLIMHPSRTFILKLMSLLFSSQIFKLFFFKTHDGRISDEGEGRNRKTDLYKNFLYASLFIV